MAEIKRESLEAAIAQQRAYLDQALANANAAQGAINALEALKATLDPPEEKRPLLEVVAGASPGA